MLRHCFFLLSLMAATTLSGGGCRSCSDCHDYDPPVAGCDCGSGQRAGSVCGCGSCGGGVSTGSCGSGGCGCGESHGTYESQSGPSHQYAEPMPEEVGT
jgi:hypothetical protein